VSKISYRTSPDVFFPNVPIEKNKCKPLSFKIRGGDPKKQFNFLPLFIQAQAAVYLGCNRISCFQYSIPHSYKENVIRLDSKLKFYKPNLIDAGYNVQEEFLTDIQMPENWKQWLPLSVKSLPSCARVCINILLIPVPGSCSVMKEPKKI
jgi:hypothetical protein